MRDASVIGGQAAVKGAAGKFPGGRKLAGLLADFTDNQLTSGVAAKTIAGEISEFAAGAAISSTGLFTEIGSVQNTSGWGVDFLAKTHDGEWISYEMKANTSQLSRGKNGRAGQKMAQPNIPAKN